MHNRDGINLINRIKVMLDHSLKMQIPLGVKPLNPSKNIFERRYFFLVVATSLSSSMGRLTGRSFAGKFYIANHQ